MRDVSCICLVCGVGVVCGVWGVRGIWNVVCVLVCVRCVYVVSALNIIFVPGRMVDMCGVYGSRGVRSVSCMRRV